MWRRSPQFRDVYSREALNHATNSWQDADVIEERGAAGLEAGDRRTPRVPDDVERSCW